MRGHNRPRIAPGSVDVLIDEEQLHSFRTTIDTSFALSTLAATISLHGSSEKAIRDSDAVKAQHDRHAKFPAQRRS
jgi:hypothetical protein